MLLHNQWKEEIYTRAKLTSLFQFANLKEQDFCKTNPHSYFSNTSSINSKRLLQIGNPIFPTSETPLSNWQSHFSNLRNDFVKFAIAFFQPPKWLCQIRNPIFPASEMPLSNSQSHFSDLRNAFVKFANAFFRPPKYLCKIRKHVMTAYHITA